MPTSSFITTAPTATLMSGGSRRSTVSAKNFSGKGESPSSSSPPPPAPPSSHDVPVRPVLLSAAVRRAMGLPWPTRLRALSAIFQFVWTDVSWWLRRGLWYVVPTVRVAQNRISIPVVLGVSMPVFDLYTAPDDARVLPALLTHAAPAPSRLATRLRRPIVLFVHGGAWGAGRSWHFSRLADAVMRRANASVAVLGYHVFPEGDVDAQAADVALSLRVLREQAAGVPLVVLAHSSGAHIVALALLRSAHANSQALADVAILSAGPFHLAHHYLFEARRGVAAVSPMQPACNADLDASHFISVSPSSIVETLQTGLCEMTSHIPKPPFLEGDMAAVNIPLPAVTHQDMTKAGCFPQTFLLTSSSDSVVPMYSSTRFAAALRRAGVPARLLVYDHVEHNGFVTHWFDEDAGAQTDMSDLLDLSSADELLRLNCVRLLHGAHAASLLSPLERSRASAAHVRDVLRILESIGTSRFERS